MFFTLNEFGGLRGGPLETVGGAMHFFEKNKMIPKFVEKNKFCLNGSEKNKLSLKALKKNFMCLFAENCKTASMK